MSSSAALIACIVRFRFDLMTPWNWNVCARRQAQRAVGVVAGDVVERQPLLRRRHAARQAHADHEAVGLLQLLLGALAAHVAVVLQVGAVELGQLGVVLGDGAGRRPRPAPRRWCRAASRLLSLMISFLERLSSAHRSARPAAGLLSALLPSIHVALVAAGLGQLVELGAAGLVVAARGFGEDARRASRRRPAPCPSRRRTRRGARRPRST